MIKVEDYEVFNCPASYLKSVDNPYYYCHKTNMKCLEHKDCMVKRIYNKCLYQLRKPNSHETYSIDCKDMAKNIMEEFKIDWN